MELVRSVGLSDMYTHTHTHTYIYIRELSRPLQAVS
jgi:hypothetical protein